MTNNAILSPCLAEFKGFLNISIDLIFPFCCISQISISSPIFILPSITVPVTMFPFPLILKQWSIISKKFLFTFFLSGSSFKLSITACFILDTFSNTFSFVDTGIMNTSCPNFVLANTFLNAAVFDSTCFWSSSISVLFSTTISLSTKSSAIMMHYAVCVWIPFVMSTTKSMTSMIWAPPIIVLRSDPWPGQSTRVNCKYYSLVLVENFYGILVRKAEKPRSRVIPLYWDWGFLSNEAVDVI